MTDEPIITLKVKLDNIFQMISNKVTSWSNTPSDDNYPSEKLVKESLDGKISKSNISGLVKNDGTVDTTSYSTFDGNYNNLTNKPTIPTVPSNVSAFTNDSGYITSSSVPSPSSTTPSADTINGSVGDGTTWARSNHTHPKSSLYAEASHTHNSMLSVYEIDNIDEYTVHYADGHLHYDGWLSNALYYTDDVSEIGDIDKELAVKGDLPTIIDNLTTNDATKVLSAKQGKVLNDLIGNAITYINQ